MNYKQWKRERRLPSRILLKTGDSVVVLSGKDKGLRSSILAVNRRTGSVSLDKAGELWDYRKKGGTQGQGELRKIPAPIHVSNVMYFSEKLGKALRIGRRKNENGRWIRCSHRYNIDLD